MPQQIKFGTDGWRGLIADDYTFENVRRVAHAMAHYIHKHEDASQGVFLAYDTRFGSRHFAEAAAETMASTGLRVRLADDYTPTPALSYCIKKYGAAGGVMITSSHNPANWNGVKFKAKYGGSGTPAIMKQIESYLDAPPISKTGGNVEDFDFKQPYFEVLKSFADLDAIAKANFRFCIDVMYGAGRGVLKQIFTERGISHVEIRGEVNPLFPGINPEPILPHIAALQEATVREKCHAGLATDGDADRIGAVDEHGNFVDAHKCFAVILKWLLEKKKWPGAITRAFNTTGMLDRMAKKHGRELVEHGIGFKYVCDVVLSGKEVLIGGEESGGIGIPRYLPERDGIMNSLLIANVMADYGMSLGQLVGELQREYGEHHYGRIDMHLENGVKNEAMRRATARPTKIGRFAVARVEDMDGMKFFFTSPDNGKDAEAWVLIRASGTEPLLRVYSEAPSAGMVQEILGEAEKFVYQRA